MDRPESQPNLSSYLFTGSLLSGMFLAATGDAQAQTSGQGGSTNSQSGAAAAPPGSDRRGAKPEAGVARGAGRPRNEPSQAYRESIRQTVEKRRQRRANREQREDCLRPRSRGLADVLPL